MKLYYHHVGKDGAKRDFGRTVFGSHPISAIDANIPAEYHHKSALMSDISRHFPEGKFNCWGIPAGGGSVINRLSPKDVVLLLESTTPPEDNMPALCEVLVYYNHQFPELSKYLWGESRYPYIFFFRTIRLSLKWPQFKEHVGYAENANPKGQFCPISDGKLITFGGASRYIEKIKEGYIMM